MNTLLVTGGLGFIGSHFIEYMLERYPSMNIINLDAATYAGNPDNTKSFRDHPGYIWVKGDIASAEDVGRVFSEHPEIQAVVHFAAESHVDRSIAAPDHFVRTNVLGTMVLLNAARASGVERFIHISTDEVYGTLGTQGYFTENSPIAPNSPYAASKAGSDMMVRSFYQTYGFPAIITHCSNNYGPRQFPEKFIPTIISRAQKDQPVPIYGDGTNVRDWLHVKDHCLAIDLVLHQGVPGEVYNIGGNCEMSNRDLAMEILDLLGKPHSLLHYVSDRLGHDWRYAIHPEKIQKELGWKPEVTLKEGLAETVAWYKGAATWLNRIETGAYRQNL